MSDKSTLFEACNSSFMNTVLTLFILNRNSENCDSSGFYPIYISLSSYFQFKMALFSPVEAFWLSELMSPKGSITDY